MRNVKLAIALATPMLLVAGTASAQQVNGFGEKGTLTINAISGTPILDTQDFGYPLIGATPLIGLQFDGNSTPTQNNRSSAEHFTTFYIAPALDYFIIDKLSIGGELLFAHISHNHDETDNNTTVTTGQPSVDVFGIAARVGYNIDFGKHFGIWPRAGIGFRYAHQGLPGGGDGSVNWLYFNIDAPVLWHPVDHFYVGVGPGVSFALTKSETYNQNVGGGGTVSVTTSPYGTYSIRILNAIIGGWF